jgi:branched-chain amino acid transport system substrate-binding protein
VRIGYYGPNDPAHPLGGTFWIGAARAIEEANREGGYRGLPFRLVQAWSENPWRAGASAVVKMVYADRVWAVIAGIDGVTAHLAEQVAAKALLPIVDPGSTDKTVNMAYVPWTFSMLPPDPVYAEAIGKALGGAGFTLYSATDHDSRALTGDLLIWLRRNHTVPLRHVEFGPGAQDAPALAAEAAAAAVVIAGPADSARLVRELKRARPGIAIYGGPAMARQSFLDLAGAAAEGVRFPLPEAGRAGFPDYAAAAAYDSVRLLVGAVRKAGLNRARIRDAIDEAAGIAGWDALNRNTHPVAVGTIRAGRRVQLP